MSTALRARPPRYPCLIPASRLKQHPNPVLQLLPVCAAFALRVLPGAVFSTLFYWLMGLRRNANAFITFLGVFCTYNCLVRDWAGRLV